jgi:hypothetical protein
MTHRELALHLRAVAAALPAGTAIPVPREALLALLDAQEPAPLAIPPEVKEPAGDRLLTVEEVAGRLEVAPQWVYRHAGEWDFTRRLGRRTLRFSEAGLRDYIDGPRAA